MSGSKQTQASKQRRQVANAESELALGLEYMLRRWLLNAPNQVLPSAYQHIASRPTTSRQAIVSTLGIIAASRVQIRARDNANRSIDPDLLTHPIS